MKLTFHQHHILNNFLIHQLFWWNSSSVDSTPGIPVSLYTVLSPTSLSSILTVTVILCLVLLYPVSCTLYSASCIMFPVFYIMFPIFCTLNFYPSQCNFDLNNLKMVKTNDLSMDN